MKMRTLLAVCAMTITVATVLPIAVYAKGHFVGQVVTRWLVQDGVDRDMELVEPFEYVDALGKRWSVPKGSRVNGASIPQALWIFGSPYTGDYRRASVVHDYYCATMTEPWDKVHRMFLEAVIDDGLSVVSAKTMYAGIRMGGPRWELKKTKNLEGNEVMTPIPIVVLAPDTRQLEDLRQWVERTNPTPTEIDEEVERRIHQQ